MSARMMPGDDRMITEALEPNETFTRVRMFFDRNLSRRAITERMTNREYLMEECERLAQKGTQAEIHPHPILTRKTAIMGIALFRVT